MCDILNVICSVVHRYRNNTKVSITWKLQILKILINWNQTLRRQPLGPFFIQFPEDAHSHPSRWCLSPKASPPPPQYKTPYPILFGWFATFLNERPS